MTMKGDRKSQGQGEMQNLTAAITPITEGPKRYWLYAVNPKPRGGSAIWQ